MADEVAESNSQAETSKSQAEAQIPEKDTAIVDEARDCLKFAKSYAAEQLQAEKDEEYFEGAPMGMWDQTAIDNRSEHMAEDGTTKIPAKPTLQANLLTQNVEQVVSEVRKAQLGLTVKPKTGLANTKTSEYYKGLARHIQTESNAKAQRIWGVYRTSKLGRGGYRLIADFAADDDFDVDLIYQRILNYGNVYWDPYSQATDRRDAEWCIEADFVSMDTRKRRWPNKPLIMPSAEVEGQYADWFEADADNTDHKRVLIATYRKVIHKIEKLAFHPTHGKKLLKDLPPEAQAEVVAGAEGTRIRDVDTRSVMEYVVDGMQVLEERPWHGQYIPIMEIIGREYLLRNKRRFKGIIADSMDILRAINVVLSAATELGGMLPRSPYVMYEGQDLGFETEWDELFSANRTRVHVRMTDIEGKPAALPQRQVTDVQVQGMLLLLRALMEMYYAVTGTVAPQMRAVNPYDRSGKAIEALQAQSSSGTAYVLDNLSLITMPYEGMVLIDAIPHYYDRPGRVVAISKDDETETAIMIKRPFIQGPDGRPIGVPCPACNGSGRGAPRAFLGITIGEGGTCPECQGLKFATKKNMPQEFQGRAVEYVDFGEGKYSVQAVVDRDTKVKQDEALAGMAALATAVPQLVPVYADLWVKAMGFSGSNEIADRLRAQTGGEEDEEMQSWPPAIQAKFQALMGQHQQAMAALEEAKKIIETDAVKSAGQKEIAVLRGVFQEKLEAVKTQGKMLTQQRDIGLAQWQEDVRGKLAVMQQDSEQRHEVLLQLLKEQGNKEIERHSVALHDAAAAAAAERADLSVSAAEAREEGRSVRAEMREEGREVRGDVRAAGADAAADARKGQQSAAADARKGALAAAEDRRKGALAAESDARSAEQAEADRQAAAAQQLTKGKTQA